MGVSRFRIRAHAWVIGLVARGCGAERMVEVVAVGDDKVVLDFNHPLAGQSLHFDVTVITSEQLSGA